MKKFITLLLVFLMVVPFGMLATTAISAAETEVYLSDNGSDDAAGTAAAPVQTMAKAYEKLGTAGGTIIIKDKYDQKANFVAPAHTGKVTIKGADANAKYVNAGGGVRYFLGGPTEFKSIKLETGMWMVVCNFNDCTFASDVTHTRTGSTFLVAGGQGGTTANDIAFKPADVTITVNGGDWEEIIGVLRGQAIDPDGAKTAADFKDLDVTINFGGNAVAKKMITFFRSAANTDVLAENASCTVNLNGGKITGWIALTDYGVPGDGNVIPTGYGKGVTINMSKNFDLANSFTLGPKDDTHVTGGVFYGISGDTVWSKTEEQDKYVKLGKTKLILDAEIYDAQKNNTLFRDVTIEKASTGTVTPPPVPTGDMTWVVAAVAAVSVMGCAVVVAKKRAK